MSNEGSSLIKFIWIVTLADTAWVRLGSQKHLIRFTYLGTLGSAGRGLRLNPDLKDEDGSTNTLSVWPSQTWHGVVPVFLLFLLPCLAHISNSNLLLRLVVTFFYDKHVPSYMALFSQIIWSYNCCIWALFVLFFFFVEMYKSAMQ